MAGRTLTCQECGGSFVSRSLSGQRKYCSQPCYFAGRKKSTRVARICSCCGNEFERYAVAIAEQLRAPTSDARSSAAVYGVERRNGDGSSARHGRSGRPSVACRRGCSSHQRHPSRQPFGEPRTVDDEPSERPTGRGQTVVGTGDPGGLRFTPGQRAGFLALIQDPDVGHVAAARQVGVAGTRGDIRKLIAADPDLQHDIQDVRSETLKSKGLGVSHLLDKLAKIASDDGNASQLRAIERGFSLHGIHFKEQLEHSGQMEVHIPDVADALERFTTLTAAAIRAASRGPTEQPALDAQPH